MADRLLVQGMPEGGTAAAAVPLTPPATTKRAANKADHGLHRCAAQLVSQPHAARALRSSGMQGGAARWGVRCRRNVIACPAAAPAAPLHAA
jgi:hypothetical protein